MDKTPKALEAEVKKAERTLQQKEEQYSDREEVRRGLQHQVGGVQADQDEAGQLSLPPHASQ